MHKIMRTLLHKGCMEMSRQSHMHFEQDNNMRFLGLHSMHCALLWTLALLSPHAFWWLYCRSRNWIIGDELCFLSTPFIIFVYFCHFLWWLVFYDLSQLFPYHVAFNSGSWSGDNRSWYFLNNWYLMIQCVNIGVFWSLRCFWSMSMDLGNFDRMCPPAACGPRYR